MVNRYDLGKKMSIGTDKDFCESAMLGVTEGKYVLHSDYKKLEAELEHANKVIAGLPDAIKLKEALDASNKQLIEAMEMVKNLSAIDKEDEKERDELKARVAELEANSDVIKMSEYIERTFEQIALLTAENGRLKEGLSLAIGMFNHVGCVQNCVGGVIQTSEDECHQCQWCDELSRVRAALHPEGGK